MNMESENGFTLVELLITIVIVTTLLAMGVPSLKDFMKQNRLSAHSNALVTALQVARTEAVKRGTDTVICASSNQTSCTGNGDWDQGWIVFSDLNLNGAPDLGASAPLCEDTEDCMLRTSGALSGNNRITTNAASLRFLPTGLAANGGATVTLNLVSDKCERDQTRRIQVTLQGHTIVTKQACP
jgi:type IV fimbrial biogenesis protein FimT